MPGMFGTWVFPRAGRVFDETLAWNCHFRLRAQGAAPSGDGFGEGIPQRVASPPLQGDVPRSSARGGADLGTFCIGPGYCGCGPRADRAEIVGAWVARSHLLPQVFTEASEVCFCLEVCAFGIYAVGVPNCVD